jgi:hypothetical protein
VDGNDLYNVLKIPDLQQFDEDPVLEIKINAKMKLRKNSEIGMTLNESFEGVNGGFQKKLPPFQVQIYLETQRKNK